MDKMSFYENIKSKLIPVGFEVAPYKEISYGFQFNVMYEGKKGLVRVYESKKGDRMDFSQVKDGFMLAILKDVLESNFMEKPHKAELLLEESNGISHRSSSEPSKKSDNLSGDPPELIGTDESGKGDYFGPLVIAGVYVDLINKSKLDELGVDDSKKLTDLKIAKLAPKIKELCPHSVIVIGNRKYNELYDKIGNLNKLLAWGHARAIENVLNDVDCGFALSDQFGNPELIKNALMEKGRKILLMQRPRAEENTAVAAASILARHEFNLKIDELQESYGMKFQKGASSMVLETARLFVEKFGKDELINAAKLHFKTTEQLK